MSEARKIIRKLLPHLSALSLDANKDELYEVKALIKDAESFLANPEQEPCRYLVDCYIEPNNSDSFVVDFCVNDVNDVYSPRNIRPLYAEPPATKTDEFTFPDIKTGDAFKWVQVSSIDEMQAFYMSRLPAIREVARDCGYAIGLHGSTRRDFDLIAVPWGDNHVDVNKLAEEIQLAACGYKQSAFQWEQKPCGRVAASFPVCWTEFYDMISAGHIDLSVMASKQELV
jgi:hypothetical protein